MSEGAQRGKLVSVRQTAIPVSGGAFQALADEPEGTDPPAPAPPAVPPSTSSHTRTTKRSATTKGQAKSVAEPAKPPPPQQQPEGTRGKAGQAGLGGGSSALPGSSPTAAGPAAAATPAPQQGQAESAASSKAAKKQKLAAAVAKEGSEAGMHNKQEAPPSAPPPRSASISVKKKKVAVKARGAAAGSWGSNNRRTALASGAVGAGVALLAVLVMQWAAHEGMLGMERTDVTLPGGLSVTVPYPSMDLTNLSANLADSMAWLPSVSDLAKLGDLGNGINSSSLRELSASLADSLPSWIPSLPNLQNLTVSELVAQLPGMGGGSSGEVSESVTRPGRALAVKGYRAKHPVVIIPGFVTSGLELWEGLPCARRYFRQRMWGTLSMMQTFLRDSSCWFDHMALDPSSGLDPPGVKIRAAQGLESVDFFIQTTLCPDQLLPAGCSLMAVERWDQAWLLGPGRSVLGDETHGYWVWGKLVEALADVGYDSNTLVSMAYDWRLAVPLMEARDGWFTRLKLTVEMLASMSGHKVVLASHSYGENVARAFLIWADEWQPGWVDKHVEAHVAIAGTVLGVPKAITALLSGEMRDTAQLGPLASYLTANLVPRESRAKLFRSWASLMAMMPVGGPKPAAPNPPIWGNVSWAPDDTPEMRAAGRSYGTMVTACPERCTSSSASSSLASRAAEAFTAAASAAAARLNLDLGGTEQVVQLDVSGAIRAALSASGPLAAEHYQQWGAVHSHAANNRKPGSLDVAGMISSLLSSSKETQQQAATGGRSTKEQAAAMPLFPNALTTPLPKAPHMTYYSLYGIGIPTERAYHYVHPDNWHPDAGSAADTSPETTSPGVAHCVGQVQQDDSGIQMQEGDMTVPLISLGIMGYKGWRSKRLNPGGMRVVAREYKHIAVSLLADPRGGPATGSHVDILGNEALLSDVIRIVTGHGAEVGDRTESRLPDIAKEIDFEDPNGWE
ncbi:Lecithin:cholesterol acyltransferase-domain-containing protein [Haematococcus lacustris]